jgi:hypothetical protein
VPENQKVMHQPSSHYSLHGHQYSVSMMAMSSQESLCDDTDNNDSADVGAATGDAKQSKITVRFHQDMDWAAEDDKSHRRHQQRRKGRPLRRLRRDRRALMSIQFRDFLQLVVSPANATPTGTGSNNEEKRKNNNTNSKQELDCFSLSVCPLFASVLLPLAADRIPEVAEFQDKMRKEKVELLLNIFNDWKHDNEIFHPAQAWMHMALNQGYCRHLHNHSNLSEEVMRSFFRFVIVLAPGDDVNSQQDSLKNLGSCDSFLHWANEDEFGFDFQEAFFQEHILLNYLLAGSIGEFVGSMSRSPAEAVKTRIQTGQYDMKGAIDHVFFTAEGRKNTFDAWLAGLFRDIPHGSIQIAVFEFSKILVVNSAADIDVNTLFSEALLGGFGGALGAFVSTPSDVVVVNVMTSMNDEGETKSPKDILAKIWNEDGVNGLFSGFAERVSYWAIAVGIFLSAYCSLRQYSVTLM